MSCSSTSSMNSNYSNALPSMSRVKIYSSSKISLCALPLILGLTSFFFAGVLLGGFAVKHNWTQMIRLVNLEQNLYIALGSVAAAAGLGLLALGSVASLGSKSSSKDKQLEVIHNPSVASSFRKEEQAIFGSESWERLGVKIIGDIPPQPDINEIELYPQTERSDYILVLIPEKIVYNEQKESLTLNTFEKIMNQVNPYAKLYKYIHRDVKSNFGDYSRKTHWVFLYKKVMDSTRKESPSILSSKFETYGFSLPSILDVVVATTMVYRFTFEPLLQKVNKRNFTYCSCKEDYKEQGLSLTNYVLVGNFNPTKGLVISRHSFISCLDDMGSIPVKEYS